MFCSFLSGSIEPLTLLGPIEPVFSFGPIEPISGSGPIEPILKACIYNKYRDLAASNPILLERHRDSIKNIYKVFLEISNNLKEIDDLAIISSEINILGNYLSELIGIIAPDHVLNSIFANFCIGK